MAQEIADSKLLDTWGSSGTKIEPDISKIIEGWQLGEQPPHEYMNWLQNTFGSKLNHILKNGIAEWNNETEYLAGASVKHSGNVWICETTNTNSEPTGSNANWEKVAISKDLTVTVDTLSDLRSISYPANTIWASGYHTKNDGAFGSHIFRLKGVKTTETDNGGTVIIATIGGVDYVYELQYDGAVNVKWFGAKGDGATDDSFPFANCIDYAKDSGKIIFAPSAIYRIVTGYNQTANKKDVMIIGESGIREYDSNTKGTIFLLDNPDANSYFYKQSARGTLKFNNITFRSSQDIKDRKFIIADSNGWYPFFRDINFEDVEKPICFTSNCYFQNGSFENIQFRNSGTFHSETDSLICTLMKISNVNHEGIPKDLTDRTLCDLRGVREFEGDTFLLEGAFAQTGWTVLKTGVSSDGDWQNQQSINIDTFHSEWSGANKPTYTLDHTYGLLKITKADAFATIDSPVRLTNQATLELENTSFAGTNDEISTLFNFQDNKCTLILNKCSIRNIEAFKRTNIKLLNCFYISSDALKNRARIDNTTPIKLISFDGGYFDDISLFNSTTYYPTYDATYERKLVFSQSLGGHSVVIRGKGQKVFNKIGNTFNLKYSFVLPTITAGTSVQIKLLKNGITAVAKNYDSTYSNKVVSDILSYSLDVDAADVQAGLSTVGNIGGQSIQILALDLFKGDSFQTTQDIVFKKNITTFNSAAPTQGEWLRGDKVYNNSPSAGGAIGWVCVSGGTPGTWKTFGTISA